MRLYKKDVGRLCLVTWIDAYSDTSTSFEAFKKEEDCVNVSVGWLVHFNKEYVYLKTETSNKPGVDDFTRIPFGWVKKVEYKD